MSELNSDLPFDWDFIDESRERFFTTELHNELCSTHLLYQRSVIAITDKDGSDDVLFKCTDGPELFEVHLTWKKETRPEWPRTKMHKDMHAFLESCDEI